MRAKAILSVLFLISLGVFSILYLESLPKQVRSSTASNEVLVATMPLASGTFLRAEDVAWRKNFRAPALGEIIRPPVATYDRDSRVDQQIYGAALRVRLAAGDSIRLNDIVKPSDRDFLRVVLSRGARAIAIPLSPAPVSAGLLFPGERVDVILTQNFKNDAPLTRRSVSETVVEGLRVLAVDGSNPKQERTGSGVGLMVTLEVTPEQAEKINVAMQLGKLSLSLRGISNTDQNFGTGEGRTITATWAGNVSPALYGASQPEKTVSVLLPPIEIFHGTKREVVKLQGP